MNKRWREEKGERTGWWVREGGKHSKEGRERQRDEEHAIKDQI